MTIGDQDRLSEHIEVLTSTETNSMADFDEAAYRPYLYGLDLSDAQAAAFERLVWSMMRVFVDLNLPVDSCGQILKGMIEQATIESDSLD